LSAWWKIDFTPPQHLISLRFHLGEKITRLAIWSYNNHYIKELRNWPRNSLQASRLKACTILAQWNISEGVAFWENNWWAYAISKPGIDIVRLMIWSDLFFECISDVSDTSCSSRTRRRNRSQQDAEVNFWAHMCIDVNLTTERV
jgi:hypothetical protein